jgi:hypothetical protein
MARTFGITVFWAQSGPNFSTNFFKFKVAASRMAYTDSKDNSYVCSHLSKYNSRLKTENNLPKPKAFKQTNNQPSGNK